MTDDAVRLEADRRVDAVLAGLNALSPDELAGVGLVQPAAERAELLAAVDEAAIATGRTDLVRAARVRAGELVLERYGSGMLHTTFVALNWGLSQGTVEDRVAIANAVQDAAAAAVVADVLDREVLEALQLDVQRLAGLSTGRASGGSLDDALAPTLPGYAPRRWERPAVLLATTLAGLFVLGVAGAIGGAAVGLIAALRPRRRPTDGA